MKKMLTLCAIATLTLGAALASAQAPGPAGGQGQLNGPRGERRGPGPRMMQEVLAKLNLTPAQKTQIEALQKKQREEMRAQFKGQRPAPGTPPDPQMREKMKAMREKYHKELMAILTPAQRKQFKEEMEALRKKWQQEHPGGPGGNPSLHTGG